MSWIDRLKELAWTSPKGQRFAPKYEDLEHSWEMKGESRKYVNADQTTARNYGAEAREFPLRLFFTGADCDIEAKRFDTALHEKGLGVLEHPLAGVFDVCFYGKATRRDDLKSAANQVVYELTFYESTDLFAPSRSGLTVSSLEDYQEQFEAQNISDTVDDTALEGVVTVAGVAAEYKGGIKGAKADLTKAINALGSARAKIFAGFDDLEASVDEIIMDPYVLVSQTAAVIKSVAAYPGDVKLRYKNYLDLLTRIVGPLGLPNGMTPADSPDFKAVFSSRRLQAGTAVSAMITAATVDPTAWGTRTAAIEAARGIQLAFVQYNEWVEANTTSLSLPNQYDDQALRIAVDLAAGALVAASWSLLQERAIVTDRARALVDMAVEFYGDPDRLDDVIITNELTGSEILEIPRGRRLVFYR